MVLSIHGLPVPSFLVLSPPEINCGKTYQAWWEILFIVLALGSFIQFTVLAQQICYMARATISLKHVNSTLKGGGKKKEDLAGTPKALLK